MMHLVSRRDEGTNELYCSLSAELRRELQQYEENRTVPQGTRLVQHQVVPQHLVILNDGSAEISLPADGKDLLLGTAQTGKVLGMREIVSGEGPEVDVVCLEDCNVTLVPRDEFLALLRVNPQIYFAIAKVLSSDLSLANQVIRRSRRSLKFAQRQLLPRPV